MNLESAVVGCTVSGEIAVSMAMSWATTGISTKKYIGISYIRRYRITILMKTTMFNDTRRSTAFPLWTDRELYRGILGTTNIECVEVDGKEEREDKVYKIE